jgi:hypothetical protein
LRKSARRSAVEILACLGGIFSVASSDPFFTGCKAPERRDRRPENPLCCA